MKAQRVKMLGKKYVIRFNAMLLFSRRWHVQLNKSIEDPASNNINCCRAASFMDTITRLQTSLRQNGQNAVLECRRHEIHVNNHLHIPSALLLLTTGSYFQWVPEPSGRGGKEKLGNVRIAYGGVILILPLNFQCVNSLA
jgi:hypothetical protein